MTEDSESIIVKLTRMEGKLDLSNMRHDITEARINTIDNRLSAHGERIVGLEGREMSRDGERKGITTSTKVIWGGFIALAGLAVGIIALLVGQ